MIFLEYKHLYYQGHNRSADPGPHHMIPFGQAKIVRGGEDGTLVCWRALVQKSLKAAKKIEEQMGKSVEVIDARTLAPFDMETIRHSLAKTNRLLVAHEETKTSGLAGEIADRINEECFESLDAPIMRVTAKDAHVPYNPAQEEFILPQVADVEESLRQLLQYWPI